MAQCEAKSKRSGERCRGSAVRGRRHCRMHGGTQPVGPASPSFKHGGRSRHLPARLLPAYEAATQDAELLNLTRDLALVEAMLADALSRLDRGEGGHLWDRLGDAWAGFEAARRNEDEAGILAGIGTVGGLIRRGRADREARVDALSLVERRRKLVETERRRLVDMQQMVTAGEAMAFAKAMIDAVTANVPDRDALAAIMDEFSRLLGRPARLAAGARD